MGCSITFLRSDRSETRIQRDRPSYIYALWDPDTFLIHYIGRSANMKDRLQKHIDNARSDTYYRSSPSEWIRVASCA